MKQLDKDICGMGGKNLWTVLATIGLSKFSVRILNRRGLISHAECSDAAATVGPLINKLNNGNLDSNHVAFALSRCQNICHV